jgi:hypothetical protein
MVAGQRYGARIARCICLTDEREMFPIIDAVGAGADARGCKP